MYRVDLWVDLRSLTSSLTFPLFTANPGYVTSMLRCEIHFMGVILRSNIPQTPSIFYLDSLGLASLQIIALWQ